MNLAEMVVALLIVVLLTVGAGQYQRLQQQAALAHDVEVVREVALQYARKKCTNPPLAPVTLAAAAIEVGRTAQVNEPERWQIVLTVRPGLNAPATSLRYVIGENQWQCAYLLANHPSTAATTHVALPVGQRSSAPNQRSFQMLLENNLC